MTIESFVMAQSACKIAYDFKSLNKSESYHASPDSIGLVGQKEISGIIPSIEYPGYFWGINDSGNGAVLHLFSLETAEIKNLFILTGISNVDWEDLAIGKDKNGKGIIYIPDIGDNKAKRKICTVYKISESLLKPSENSIQYVNLDNPATVLYTYSNGARDAEAMAYDPIENQLIVVTKREDNVMVYPIDPNTTSQTVEPLGSLAISNVVGADFTENGSKFILKTYTHIYEWQRSDLTESLCDLLSKSPTKIPYQIEPQGESICYVNGGFITLSEERFGIKPVLYKYRLK